MTQPSADQVTAVLNSSVQAPLDGWFQVALVLAGTASTGAYTAGFLDKLIEALDAWYGAKTKGEDVPQHEVRLRVATGASGGGVSAALLARMLAYGIEPVRPGSTEDVGKAHLLYDTWVNRLDIGGMVDLADLQPNQTPKSLLNGAPIKAATATAAATPSAPLPLPHGWYQRPYVDNPFRVIVTLGNLTGVPYRRLSHRRSDLSLRRRRRVAERRPSLLPGRADQPTSCVGAVFPGHRRFGGSG